MMKCIFADSLPQPLAYKQAVVGALIYGGGELLYSISGYLAQAILATLFITLLLIAYRVYRAKFLHKKVLMLREIGVILFAAYLTGLLALTIMPQFEFTENGFGIYRPMVNGSQSGSVNLVPFRSIVNGISNDRYMQMVGNILLFVPFGIFVILVWNIKTPRALIIGAGLSVFIEIVQLPLARETDVDDVILNFAGVVIGWVLYRLMWSVFHQIKVSSDSN